MRRQAFIRWIKGLIPTFIILFVTIWVGVFVWLATLGVPDNIKDIVEKELKELGLDVEMGKLKVSVWGGLYLEARDVTFHHELLRDKESGKAEKLRLDLNMDALWAGDFKLNRIELVNGFGTVPLSRNPEDQDFLMLEDINAVAGFDEEGGLVVKSATAIVEGMTVNLEGRIAGNSETSELSGEEIDEIFKTVRQIAGYVNDVTWPVDSPPLWTIRITSNNKKPTSRYVVDMEAAELEYHGVGVRDVILESEIMGNSIRLKRLMCRELDGRGKFSLVANANLKEHTVYASVRSEVPIVSWAKNIFGLNILPLPIELRSALVLRGECNVRFKENWMDVDELHVIGRTSVDAFTIGGVLYDRFSARFSYEKASDMPFEQGNFYLSDVVLSKGKSELSGQVLGKDKNMRFEVRNTLEVDTVYQLIHAFKEEDIKLPEQVEVKGVPDFYLTGHLSFQEGWDSSPSVEEGRVLLKLNNFEVYNVMLDSVALDAEIDHERFIVNQCSIREGGRKFDFLGESRGDDIYFSCKSDIRISLFNELLEKAAVMEKLKLPGQLKLPEMADFTAQGIISLTDDGDVDVKKLDLALKTDQWQWNGVEFKELDFELKTYGEHIEYVSFNLFHGDDHFDLFVQGDLTGEVMFIAQTTISLGVFDKVLGLKDDDFFFERFKYTKDSRSNASFYGTVDLNNPEETYSVSAEMEAFNTYYQGVLVSSASASITVASNRVTMKNARMEIDNRPYLNEKKLKGSSLDKGRLSASEVLIDFNNDSVAIKDLKADVFPDYALRMFSSKAAEALSMFRYHSTVDISGSGVFPMEDDFSMMRSTIYFNAGSAPVEYDLLGTTLRMTSVKGTANITPSWVKVSKLSGRIWGGSFSNGIFDIQIDNGNAINGVIAASGMNLAEVGKSYDIKMSPVPLEASISFRSQNGDVKTMTGSGNISLYNGDLIEIPIFGKLGSVLGQIPGIGHLIVYNIRKASCDYYIRNGKMYTDHFVAEGTNMALNGTGSVDLETTRVDADLQLSFKGIPGLLTSPVYVLFGGLFKVKGKGPLNNVDWYPAPFSSKKPR